MPYGQQVSNWAAGSLANVGWGVLLEKGFDIFEEWAQARIRQNVGISPVAQLPATVSLPPGSTGTMTNPAPGSGSTAQLPAVGTAGMPTITSPSLATTGFHGASGLWHLTPCGNIAANQVAFETTADKQGNPIIFGAAVKRISMAKLKRHILAQVRSTGRRAHHHHPRRHHHHRRRPRRRR